MAQIAIWIIVIAIVAIIVRDIVVKKKGGSEAKKSKGWQVALV